MLKGPFGKKIYNPKSSVMKVLMINSVSGFGSTGSICVDIATELERQNHECYIAYGQVSRGYEKEFKIGTRLENHLHNIGSRVFGKQGYFTKTGTKKLVAFIKDYNPDVIHLHNLHGNYLNLEILFEYLNEVQKPVVWTLHDCWAFTGKCAHYTEVACYKWETHCHKCPQVNSYPSSIVLDQSNTMFEDKKKWFTSIDNLTIIPVSNWLSNEVKRSFLGNKSIKMIYNWVNHEVFKPYEEDVKEKYNIPNAKFIILGVSAGWSCNSIKFKDFITLSKILPEDIQIVLIGKSDKNLKFPSNIIHIPYVENTEELAKLYSNADVYVHLSREDTFGKVIAEALSCGTPAIVYNATGCPEIVGEGCGYVVDKGAIEEVKSKILTIKQVGKENYSVASRKFVLGNFDIHTNIDVTIEMYKNILAYDI